MIVSACNFRLPQVEISAQHGSIVLTRGNSELVSDGMNESPAIVSGTPWQVNAALRSMVYLSAEDWHGWDKITITLTDLGGDDVAQTTAEHTAYYLYISVAAVNDAPILTTDGLEAVTVSSQSSSSSAFLVPAQEDTARIIYGVAVSDVDTAAEGLFLNRPDGFFATFSTDGMGNGAELLAVEPKIALYLSCEYGLLGLGGGHGGLEVDEGDLDGGEQRLLVTGTLSNINAALRDGIVYTPAANWNGVDVVEVREKCARGTLTCVVHHASFMASTIRECWTPSVVSSMLFQRPTTCLRGTSMAFARHLGGPHSFRWRVDRHAREIVKLRGTLASVVRWVLPLIRNFVCFLRTPS